MQRIIFRALIVVCLLLNFDAAHAQKRAKIDRSEQRKAKPAAAKQPKKKTPAAPVVAPAAKQTPKAAARSKVVAEPEISVTHRQIDVPAYANSYFHIGVNANCGWRIKIEPYSWGHVTRDGNRLIYHADANQSSEARTDFIELVATNARGRSKTCRIHIRQAGSASARPFINADPSSLTFSCQSGSRTITVDSNCDWQVSVGTAAWGTLTRSGNQLTLRVDANSSTSSRSDYFVLKGTSSSGATVEKRIEITQAGRSREVKISRVWVEHNEWKDGSKGMRIHAYVTINGYENETLQYGVEFFHSDNRTYLHDRYGNKLVTYFDVTPRYLGSVYDDLEIFVPYGYLNMAPGSHSLTFDFAIKKNGDIITRNENNGFTYSR